MDWTYYRPSVSQYMECFPVRVHLLSPASTVANTKESELRSQAIEQSCQVLVTILLADRNEPRQQCDSEANVTQYEENATRMCYHVKASEKNVRRLNEIMTKV